MELKYNKVISRTMLVSFIIVMLLVSTGIVFAQPEPKITICQHTGSDKNPQVTISIDESALSIHLAHGDTIGPCQTPIPPVPEVPTTILMGLGLFGLLFITRRSN